MKSPSQVLTFILVLAGLVGGITFVSQWVTTGPAEPTAKVGSETAAGATLKFPKVEGDECFAEMAPAKGHCDFWFENDQPGPVELGLDAASCKCSSVEARVLSPEEEATYRWGLPAGAAQTLLASGGLTSWLVPAAWTDRRLQDVTGPGGGWKPLKDDKLQSVTVSPRGTGLVRVGWEGKEARPQRIKATLWTQAPGQAGARAFTALEVVVNFVHPVEVEQRAATDSAPLLPGGKKTTTFLTWSATQAGYNLTARLLEPHPCFECVCTPLSGEECRGQLDALGKKVPALAGYLVAVTAYERRGEHQLDLGTYTKKVLLESDALTNPAAVEVTGEVHGDIRLVDGDNRIILGLWDARSGMDKPKQVTIEADQSGLELEIERHSPEYLDVKLVPKDPLPDGRRLWDLIVNVAPNRPSGRLPAGSAVVLKTKGTPPRRFSIPVLGHATIR